MALMEFGRVSHEMTIITVTCQHDAGNRQLMSCRGGSDGTFHAEVIHMVLCPTACRYTVLAAAGQAMHHTAPHFAPKCDKDFFISCV